MLEGIKISGFITITLHDRNNDVIWQQATTNLITTTGYNTLSEAILLSHTSASTSGLDPTHYPRYLVFGYGTSTPSSNDTALENPEASTVKEFTSINLESPGKVHMVTFYDTSEGLPNSSNTAYNEIGIYGGTITSGNFSSAILISRQVLSPAVLKTSSITMTVDWTYAFSA